MEDFEMSDEEEVQYVKRQKTIHYGSLETSERQKLMKPDSDAAAVPKETAQTNADYFDLDQEIQRDKVALLEEFERKKKARHVQVSTDDSEIKRKLRELGEPICLFGEGPFERRVRLRELLSTLGESGAKRAGEDDNQRRTAQEAESTWYHEGPDALRTARLWIAYYSLPRAKDRLQDARELKELSGAVKAGRTVELQKKIQSLSLQCSQVGDTRPVNACQFSSDSSLLLTGSYTGVAKVWSMPDCALVQELRGHKLNIGGVAFRPNARRDTPEVAIATSSADGMVKLWALGTEEAVADISGHVPHRVSRLSFHPSGRFLGTACYDASWRFWDLEQKQEVLHQEGHAKAVHCIAFQVDGSVAITGGLDTFGRVWDLRTGRCVMFLEGHLGAIYGCDFSPNGFHLLTGSADNTAKIWDLRRRQMVYTIPAHTNIISDVKYQKNGGNFLCTTSYDNTAKIWSNKTWQPLKTLSGHDNKIMSIDISGDSQHIATTSWDRTFKLWAPE